MFTTVNYNFIAIYMFAANIILAGGWGEWRLRIDDDELAIAKDTKHGQLLLRTAIGPLARESAVVRRPSRSNAASSRCPFQSEVGGQSARLDIIPRPRYVVLLLLLFSRQWYRFLRHALCARADSWISTPFLLPSPRFEIK